jgi:F-type H+-transporting ATPase subunit b
MEKGIDLSIHWNEVIWTFVNFMILFTVFRLFLFKRLTNIMDARTKSIEDNIAQANSDKVQAAEMKRNLEEQLKNARVEADKIVSESRQRAEAEHSTILSSAREEAQNAIISSREQIERERQQMIGELKAEVSGLALTAASKVIEANMNTEKNREMVQKFLDEEGAA